MMSVVERVRLCIVRLAPAAACGGFLAADALNVHPRQQVNHKTTELAWLPAFDRRIGYCSLCEKNTKLVICYTGSSSTLRGSA